MKQTQEEHMSVFDPERAIFIGNKWDQIHEEPDKVFQMVQDTLEQSWIGFDPDKLYRLSAREVITLVMIEVPTFYVVEGVFGVKVCFIGKTNVGCCFQILRLL